MSGSKDGLGKKLLINCSEKYYKVLLYVNNKTISFRFLLKFSLTQYLEVLHGKTQKNIERCYDLLVACRVLTLYSKHRSFEELRKFHSFGILNKHIIIKHMDYTRLHNIYYIKTLGGEF